MKFSEAISLINGSEIENKSELLEAINSRLQETALLEKQVQDLSKNLTTILDLTGATEGDLSKKLETARTSINGLKEAESNYQVQLAEKDKALNSLRLEGAVSEAARLSQANAHVLKTLMSSGQYALEIKEGKPFIKNGEEAPVELKIYAEKNWADFSSALFPTGQLSTPGVGVSLPTGGSSGTPQQQSDVVADFLKSTYGGVPKLLGVADAN